MTKKRTNQDAIKGADDMAYISGAHAAREAVNAMAEVANDYSKVSAITANLMEELRTLAHPSASRGAAEVMTFGGAMGEWREPSLMRRLGVANV